MCKQRTIGQSLGLLCSTRMESHSKRKQVIGTEISKVRNTDSRSLWKTGQANIATSWMRVKPFCCKITTWWIRPLNIMNQVVRTHLVKKVRRGVHMPSCSPSSKTSFKISSVCNKLNLTFDLETIYEEEQKREELEKKNRGLREKIYSTH